VSRQVLGKKKACVDILSAQDTFTSNRLVPHDGLPWPPWQQFMYNTFFLQKKNETNWFALVLYRFRIPPIIPQKKNKRKKENKEKKKKEKEKKPWYAYAMRVGARTRIK
jgi:hypothetical protein